MKYIAIPRVLVAAVLVLSACGGAATTGALVDPADAADAPDRVVLLDVTIGASADADTDTASQPDIPKACPNECAKGFPTVPQCKVTSWDIKTCTCSLRPAEDGGACDDGDACTAGDSCVAGLCVGGGPDFAEEPDGGWSDEGSPLLPQTWAPGAPAVIYRETDCRLCDNRRAFLVSPHSAPNESLEAFNIADPGDGEIWIIQAPGRLATYSTDLSPGSSIPASKFPLLYVRGLETTHVGSVRLVGAGTTSGAGGGGWVAGYTAPGEIAWEVISSAVPNLFLLGLLSSADGTNYVLGGGGDRVVLLVVSKDGKLEATIDVGPGQANLASTYGVVLSGDEQLIVSYGGWDADRLKSGQHWPRAIATRRTASGGMVWTTELGSRDMQSLGGPLVSTPKGYLVVGRQAADVVSNQRRVLPFSIWHLSEAGDLLSERTVVPPWPNDWQYAYPYNAMETPDGGALVVGYMQRVPVEGVTADAFMMKLDAWANPEWMRFYGGPHYDRLLDAVFGQDGTITAVGGVVASGDNPGIDRFILRTDFWGRTCGMRLGVCADMPWQECEDGNPCTINWCDPDAGCTHPALPDGSPCGEGLTCQGAVCK